MNFRTDAQNFKIHYSIKNVKTGNYPHLGVTAREGIHLLYKYPNTKNWYNVDAFSSRNSPIDLNMKHIIKKGETYEIMIYGPLLCEIDQLKIETPEKSEIEFYKNDENKTILIAGGIHSFGIGCTACGVMFPNILGRKLNMNIKNISFNDYNHLEKTNKYLKKMKHPKSDMAILELDYINQENEIFDKYAEKVIKQMASKTNNLICWYAIPQEKELKHEKLKKIRKKYSNKKKIHIFDFSFVFDEEYSEMCTHSKNYINDTGNIMIYKKLEENIKKILESSKN